MKRDIEYMLNTFIALCGSAKSQLHTHTCTLLAAFMWMQLESLMRVCVYTFCQFNRRLSLGHSSHTVTVFNWNKRYSSMRFFFSVCCFLLRLLLLHPYFPHHIVYSLFNLQIGLHFTKCKLSLYSLFCVRVSLCVHPIGNGVTALQSGKSQNSNANEEERANETETLMAIYEKPNESLP